MTEDFVWRDGERMIIFREGALASAPQILEEQSWTGFDLLTTQRALEGAPEGLLAIGAIHHVPPGGVPEAAKAIMAEVRSGEIVALGGGRVIDTAKAIAAAQGGRVCAIPTTLSGAEMTQIHRLPTGHEGRSLVRPALVIADPDGMTSQPEDQLRASAMNALAHGADCLYTPFANPVSSMAALRGAELMAETLDTDPAERDRSGLALASILCAYALDSALFALHHVVCQTLVRICGIPHAETNAAMLPRTMGAMRGHAPDAIAELAAALDTQPGQIEERIAGLAGGSQSLGELGADRAKLDEVVDAVMQRPELQFTPNPPGSAEIADLLANAW